MAVIRCKLCNVDLDEKNFLLHIEEKHKDVFFELNKLDLERHKIDDREAVLIRGLLELKK